MSRTRVEEQELADELRGRPSPRKMAIPCIFDETAELRELWEEGDEHGYLVDPISERFGLIGQVLEDRLDPRFPSCPVCGGKLDADHEGIVRCTECRDLGRVDDETHAEVEIAYERQRQRVWGWRGHGEREPAEGAA